LRRDPGEYGLFPFLPLLTGSDGYDKTRRMTQRPPSLEMLRGEAARFARPRTAKEAAIVDAATRLFGEQGYEATHTAQIAAAAGVTERTLFRYFPSKEKLYRRVMFPALLVAAVPRALNDAGVLFGTDADSYEAWHRRVLTLRVAGAREAAPQYRLLVSSLMSDEGLRRRVIQIWKDDVFEPLLATVRRFQTRGELRADLKPEILARAIISLNLGYIFAAALFAPEASWDDAAEIAATVDLMISGAGVTKAGK
jgi:TetR/AcrR family transcriptional regulator